MLVDSMLRCSRRRLARLMGLAALALTGLAGCSEEGSVATESGAAASPTEGSPPPAEAPAESAAPAAEPAPEPRSRELVVLAGGDVSLARGAGQRILKQPDYDPFAHVKPLLDSADLTFVNLESQLTDQAGETQHPDQKLVFCGPPGGARVLARSGVDIVSIANNHAWDYGKRALFETMQHLSIAGVAFTGASKKPGRMYQPTVVEKNGWSVAFFAVTQIWNQGALERHEGKYYVAGARFDLLKQYLRRARKEHDVVLVSYHGGSEYLDMPLQWTRDFVKAVMLAGADAVIGHHPHVPHGVGWFDSRPAFYSLGNLVFGMHRDYPWTGTGFFARMTFAPDEAPRVEACPYRILGHQPRLFTGDSAENALQEIFSRHLRKISVTVGRTELGEPGEHSCIPLGPPKRRNAKALSGKP